MNASENKSKIKMKIRFLKTERQSLKKMKCQRGLQN